jgi:dolichyl-phosphate beta-glucosyltransferase
MSREVTDRRLSLTVVIPAYNEEDRLERSLVAIDRYLRERSIEGEIVVADDGSTDRTAGVAELFLRGRTGRVLREAENRGKGHAVRRGVRAAAGRWVLITDADLSTPIEEHAKLAREARDHDLDVVIGSRGLPGSRVELRQSRIRETLGRSFNRLVRRAAGLPFRDTQCGFKLLDRPRVLPLFERMVVDGFAWDVELLLLCTRFGLAVREVPVVWRNSPRTAVSLAGAPPRMLLDLARMLWRFRRGGYNPDAGPPGGEA